MSRSHVVGARSAWLVVAAISCVGGACSEGHKADAPLSPAASRVVVLEAPKPACIKLGRANGIGRGPSDTEAAARATEGAQEQAVKLGGNSLVPVSQQVDVEAGQGGTVMVVTKAMDVYQCGGGQS